MMAADVVLAADVVYDPDITDAFFRALAHVVEGKKKGSNCAVYIAIERRDRIGGEGEVAAPNFEHFLKKLKELSEEHEESWTLREVKTDFEQFFDAYERVGNLFMWELQSVKKL